MGVALVVTIGGGCHIPGLELLEVGSCPAEFRRKVQDLVSVGR